MNRVWIWCALLLCSLGVILRVAALPNKFAWYDEQFSLFRAEGRLEAEIQQLLEQNEESSAQDLLRFIAIRSDATLQDVAVVHQIEDPQHPPLYYELLHLWRRAAGESFLAGRVFSILLGICGMLSSYFLGREISKIASSELIYLPSLMLLMTSLSPLYFIYSIEIRDYALFIPLALTGFAFCLALRREQTVFRLTMFSLTNLALIYTTLLSATLIAGMYLYLLAVAGRSRKKKDVVRVLGSGAFVFAASLYWLNIIWSKREHINRLLGWVNQSSDLRRYFTGLAELVTVTVFDSSWIGADKLLYYAPGFLVISFSVVLFLVKRERRILFLFAALILPAFIPLFISDVRSGGIRLLQLRYLLPTLLVVSLVVPVAVALLLQSSHGYQRRIGAGLCSLVSALSLFSIAGITASPITRAKVLNGNIALLPTQIFHDAPLVAVDSGSATALSIAALLEPNGRIRAIPRCLTCVVDHFHEDARCKKIRNLPVGTILVSRNSAETLSQRCEFKNAIFEPISECSTCASYIYRVLERITKRYSSFVIRSSCRLDGGNRGPNADWPS